MPNLSHRSLAAPCLVVVLGCAADPQPTLPGSGTDAAESSTSTGLAGSTGAIGDTSGESSSSGSTTGEADSSGGDTLSCALRAPTWYPTPVFDLVLADLDADGDDDVAVALEGDGLGLFETEADGTLSGPLRPEGLPVVEFLGTGDLDGDGVVEFIAEDAVPDGGTLSVIFNDLPDGVRAVGAIPIPYFAEALRTADLDGDGDVDLAAGDLSGSRILIWHNDGSGELTPAPDVLTQGDAYDLLIEDVDGDGDVDLAYGEGDSIGVAINDGVGGFDFDTSFSVAQLPDYDVRGLVAADVDGDGDLDLAAAVLGSDYVAVLINAGDGTFADFVRYDVGGEPWYLAAIDVTHDGAVDLVVSNTADRSLGYLRNLGDGTFAAHVTLASPSDGRILATDLDGDGGTDLVLADRGLGQIGVMLSECSP